MYKLLTSNFAIALFVTLASSSASAQQHDGLAVTDAWSKALPAVVPNGAVYLRIQNHGEHPDRLRSVSTLRAKRAEIHTHMMEDGLMKMRHLEEGLDIAGKSTIMLAPGGHHIMLMKLTEPLVADQNFAIRLNFDKAGEVTLQVKVLSLADAANKPKTGHGMHHGKTMQKHDTSGGAHKHGASN